MKAAQALALNLIDEQDALYCIRPIDDNTDLLVSVKAVGMLAPVYVQKKDNSLYRIVTGFRRVAAARALGMDTIPAFVINDEAAPLQAFVIQIYDNLSTRPFRPAEIAAIIQKLAHLGGSREEIINTWLPLLGYGKNPRIYELYGSLPLTEQFWLKALDDEQISLDLLAELGHASQTDRDAFADIFQALRPGKNNQREYWALCRDIARMENCTIAELVNRQTFTMILSDKVLSPAQKGERFKQTLWEMRYPRYMQVKSRFQNLIKKAKLPPDIQIIPAPYFDDNVLTLSLVCKNAQDYKEKLELLQAVADNGIIKELFGLVE
ncbi:MAG TPA: ParB/RepB/Spo0J family partition protein [bacterium]|nr:ParB/RepB/Spo0J family partition protein [bacterium]HPN45118.1 ParB/RepB/Spo0J family partition protein [bacterium]